MCNKIIQYIYGGDGLGAEFLEYQTLDMVFLDFDDFEKNIFGCLDDEKYELIKHSVGLWIKNKSGY